VRNAEAARKKWFVIGRLLVSAAESDKRWVDLLRLLIRSAR
jgi:hypothetical protein